ncbi:MAG: 30S ribosomal protein S8 [Firmicutes bacterium]|nr:30S ribosomal protein S8 [Bacillota bacterium]MDY5041648.1 30S ribosomal protein S8 [Eubacteriales bacterium]
MITTDPIADMLTRMRNALTVKHKTVTVPASKMKLAIADLLKNEGYIDNYSVTEGAKSSIVIDLKYGPNNQKVINGLKRISKPGLRIYASYEDLPRVLNGLGIAIVSTSKGLMTDKQAREQKIGGEVLAYVW